MEDHQKGERRREYFQSQRGKEKNLPLKGKLWQLFELNILKTVSNFFPLPSPHPATQRAKFYSRPPNTRFTSYFVVAVQSLSHVQHFATPWTPQHARLPCPSPSPRACSNPCPLSQWYPIISSSAVPFSSCLQSFPASGSFPVSQLFASGGQRIGVSASVLPMNIQGWFPLGLAGLISLLSKDSQCRISSLMSYK